MVCMSCQADLGGIPGSGLCPACAAKVINGRTRKARITRPAFLRDAKPIKLTFDGVPINAGPREFNTGSLGWWGGGKVNIQVGDVPVPCQVTCSIVVIGSKEKVT